MPLTLKRRSPLEYHPRYLGIDPGASGGLAIVSWSQVADKVAMGSLTLQDLWQWVWTSNATFAYIEKVGGFMKGSGEGGAGGGAANGHAMFQFGKSFGILLMALTAASIPFEEVTPQRWQKGLGIPPKQKGKGKTGESKSEFKTRLKAKAQQLFPGETITLATADAVLLAEFCRRSKEG